MDTTTSKTQNTRGPIGGPLAPIPDYIVLPDGRRFKTRDLMNRVGSSQSVNLLKERGVRIRRGAPVKYSIEEREWIISASLEEIMCRYGKNKPGARVLKHQSREVLNSNNES